MHGQTVCTTGLRRLRVPAGSTWRERLETAALCDAPAVLKLDARNKRLRTEALETARLHRGSGQKRVRALQDAPQSGTGASSAAAAASPPKVEEVEDEGQQPNSGTAL